MGKKKRKGHNNMMYNDPFYVDDPYYTYPSSRYGGGFGYHYVREEHDITDITDYSKLAILIHKQKDLPFHPIGSGNEYQFMYHAATYVIEDPKTREQKMFITVPLVFFSHPQRVSGASVNFNIQDIAVEAEKNIEVAKQKFEELKQTKFHQLLSKIAKVVITTTHSAHKHPGRRPNWFSSGDRDKSVDNPGVIYRNRRAHGRLQHDMVITYENGKVWIGCSETYIVNVEPVSEKTEKVSGTYTRIPTITYLIKDETGYLDPFVAKLLGIEKLDEKITPENLEDRCEVIIDSLRIPAKIENQIKSSQLLLELVNLYNESNFEPAQNIVEEHYQTYNYYHGSYNKNYNQSYNESTKKDISKDIEKDKEVKKSIIDITNDDKTDTSTNTSLDNNENSKRKVIKVSELIKKKKI